MLILQKKKSPRFILKHTLDNPNPFGTSQDDRFALSTGISGTYTIIGARQEDDAGGNDSGKVYIYNNSTGNIVHTLDNPNPVGTSAFDNFGYSVAVDGNYAIIGAPSEDDSNNDSGKAYIYDVTTGNLVHTLNNPNPFGTSQDDYFGISVDITGNRCIVGAHGEDEGGGVFSGKAYIFDVTTGNLVHTIDNANAYGTPEQDQFGIEVAIDGNVAIIGARLEDDASGSSSGKAYLYNVTTGNLLHTLDNPNVFGTSDTDVFGRTVDVSGNRCIVGAHGEDETGFTNSGKAYIFDVNSGNLIQTLNNPDPVDNDFFGQFVAISGNYAAVSARGHNIATDAGIVHVYHVPTGDLLHSIENPNAYGTSAGDGARIEVNMNGNFMVVGAPDEDDAGGTESGKAYVFELSTK